MVVARRDAGAAANSRMTWGTTKVGPSGAPIARSRASAKRLGTTKASACAASRPLPGHQRDAVGGRLGARAAAVERDPRQRVAAVAAQALVPVAKAHADRAHQPVLVQVQHHPRSGLARRGEGAPAERGVEVVGVHDARTGAADRPRHLVGVEATAHEARGRARPADPGRIALQQLGILAQLVAHEPEEIVDRLLLAAGGSIAMVQEEDHVFRSACAQNVSVRGANLGQRKRFHTKCPLAD